MAYVNRDIDDEKVRMQLGVKEADVMLLIKVVNSVNGELDKRRKQEKKEMQAVNELQEAAAAFVKKRRELVKKEPEAPTEELERD